MPGPAGQDHQIGRMQPAQFAVEIAQARGQAGDVAGLMECPFGAFDAFDQRGFE